MEIYNYKRYIDKVGEGRIIMRGLCIFCGCIGRVGRGVRVRDGRGIIRRIR